MSPVLRLAFTALFAFAAAVASAAPTKRDALEHLADAVLTPGHAELAEACNQFSITTDALAETPGAATLAAGRAAWLRAALAARALESLRSGPVVEGGHAPLFYFRPARSASIERLLRDSPPATVAELSALGAAVKGLAAAEYLLFAETAPDATRRAYLRLLAHDLASHAARLERAWATDSRDASAQAFIATGQAGFTAIVNQLAWHLVAVQLALDGEEPLAPRDVELQAASLAGARRIADAAFAAWLGQLGAAGVAARLDAGLAAAETAHRTLAADPTSQVLRDTARERTREAEFLVKTELAGALGVTLSFSPVDGD